MNRREEVRGLFVLGVIAVLIVLHSDSALWPVARVLVDTLLVFWGAYAILTVVGLSEDVFGRRISRASSLAGLYALGCAVAYCLSFALLYLYTKMIVSLILFLNPPSCSTNGLPSPVALILCALLLAVVVGLITLGVFLIGFIPALFVPPVLVAWHMSRKYGKKIWLACASVLMVDVVAILVWFDFLSKMLSG